MKVKAKAVEMVVALKPPLGMKGLRRVGVVVVWVFLAVNRQQAGVAAADAEVATGVPAAISALQRVGVVAVQVQVRVEAKVAMGPGPGVEVAGEAVAVVTIVLMTRA